MSHDTQSTGSGTPNGQTPSWAPPGEGWVGSGHTGPQQARDPYRSAPTAPQPTWQDGQHAQGGHQFGGHGSGDHSAWYGTPAADPAGGGGHSTTTPTRERRGPGWAGVVAIAAVAALIGGSAAFAGARLTDQTAAPASASSSIGGSGGGTADNGGSAAQAVPLDQAVNWSQVAERVEPSVVTIQVSNGQTGGEGTGIILDKEGHVVTNNHVATAAGTGGEIRIILSNGAIYQGKITGTDPSTDLAVIQIQNPPSDLQPAVFGDSSKVVVGQNVMAIGNPLGLQDTVTTGIISATDRPTTTQASEQQQQQPDPFGFNQQQQQPDTTVYTNALQTDAAINPGNSGGPLVDASGQVIGVNSSIASLSDGSGQAGSIGLGFAIPGNEVSRVAKELIQNGKAEHARLGIELTGDGGTATASGTTRQAAIVANVTSGSAAASAGLQKGDAITAVDGTPVTSSESLIAQIHSRAPGDTVTLQVVRNGQQQDVQVKLGTATGSD
ncbi:S1C family serine protease [Quadrisphaera oryzae]|uniref:S1C family serine protease n=1 Tax=Quadrisphaera TaxID=317661 RepID=UPI001645A4C4|nr:trypsin-like peptidase domain-containing protein [Quadrisphaera sp. RL12-1S]MBC3763108.1 trypsin-like peptidase domain-containing protein [Quadrisphaera sp. RL12-1S]